MRLISWEFRKLVRPSMLGVVLVFIAVYLLASAIDYALAPISDAPYDYERFLIQSDLLGQFGTELKQDALDELARKGTAFYRTMDRYFEANLEMQIRGIHTREQFRAYKPQDVEDDTAVNEAYEQMMREVKTDKYFWQTLFIAQAYDQLEMDLRNGYRLSGKETAKTILDMGNPALARRYNELGARGWDSNMTSAVYDKMDHLTRVQTSALLLATLLLSALLPSLDALRRARPLQYATRNGRGVFKRQALCAALLSMLIITLVYWGLVVALILRTGGWPFFACDISSTMITASPFWYDLTLLQYIGIKFMLLILLCLCAAMLGHLVGQFASNYVQMLGALIPLGLAMNWVRGYALDGLFYVYNAQPFTQPLVVIALFFFCVTLFVCAWRWNKHRSVHY